MEVVAWPWGCGWVLKQWVLVVDEKEGRSMRRREEACLSERPRQIRAEFPCLLCSDLAEHWLVFFCSLFAEGSI